MSNLNPQQFAKVADLMKMGSADYGVPMNHALPHMRAHYAENQQKKRNGEEHEYSPGQEAHGGPLGHVNHLANDMRQSRRVHTPVTIRDGNLVADGHHRILAARRAGLSEVPVKHVTTDEWYGW